MQVSPTLQDYNWYLDLDDTLIDLRRFYRRLYGLAEHTYRSRGVRAWRMRMQQPQFYHQAKSGSPIRYYKLFDHFAQYGISKDAIHAELVPHLAAEDFLFEDVSSFLKTLHNAKVVPKILTIGDIPTQLFKVSLTQLHGAYEVVIIDEPKGAYLRRSAGSLPIILVDDKVVKDMPGWGVHVLLDRNNRVREYKGPIISNLLELV